MPLNRTPWPGQLYVCEFHLHKHSSCSSSQHLSPVPGAPLRFHCILLKSPGWQWGAGDGAIPELSCYFLGCYLPKSVQFHPRPTRHSLALLPQGGLHGHRTLQASATEGWFMPTLHPEALLVGAGWDRWKCTGQSCETCQFFPFTLNDSALKWEQR